MSYITSLNVIPMGTSTSPVFVIFPPNANIFVPGDFAVPKLLNHSGPFSIICGTFAKVSTLFITVGFFHNPWLAGNGGLIFAIPLFP